MKYKILVLVIVAAFLAVPAAYGNEGKIILNPGEHSAQIYENYTVSMKFNGSSTIIDPLYSGLSNVSHSVSIHSSSSIYTNLTGAIQGNASAASVSNLKLDLLGIKEMSGTALFYNISMGFAFNITGIYDAGVWNLSWRSASFTADIASYLNTAILSAYGASHIYVDMSNMSLPLTEWNKTYDPATNVTTFTHSTHFATTTPIPFGSITMSFVFDPTYTIVAPGHATAGADTIYTAPIPSGSSPIGEGMLVAIVAFVVIVAAGVSALVITKRRK